MLVRLLVALAVAIVPAIGVLTGIRAGEPLPYDLTVHAVYDRDFPGSEALREEIQRRVTEEILWRGCVREVSESSTDEEPTSALLLRIVLGDFREETRFDTRIEQQLQRRDPTQLTRELAVFQADLRVELLVMPGGQSVRSDRFRQTYSRRPITDEEDAAATAREEGLRDIVRFATAKVCKGAGRKLRNRIEAASR
jgi:hypothetical protein